MIATTRKVNKVGIEEVRGFLAHHYNLRPATVSDCIARVWADMANIQLDDGNSATISIPIHYPGRKSAITFTISAAGIDTTTIDDILGFDTEEP